MRFFTIILFPLAPIVAISYIATLDHFHQCYCDHSGNCRDGDRILVTGRGDAWHEQEEKLRLKELNNRRFTAEETTSPEEDEVTEAARMLEVYKADIASWVEDYKTQMTARVGGRSERIMAKKEGAVARLLRKVLQSAIVGAQGEEHATDWKNFWKAKNALDEERRNQQEWERMRLWRVEEAEISERRLREDELEEAKARFRGL